MNSLSIPETASFELRDFLQRILTKNPEERLTIAGMREHPWVTSISPIQPLPTTEENCAFLVTQVTDEELKAAIKKVHNLFTVVC